MGRVSISLATLHPKRNLRVGATNTVLIVMDAAVRIKILVYPHENNERLRSLGASCPAGSRVRRAGSQGQD